MNRWRPTLATPGSSSVGPPSSSLLAGSVAPGIERLDREVLARELNARLVQPPPEHVRVRRGDRQVVAKQHRAAAPRHEPAERLDVLVQALADVRADHERTRGRELVIDLAERVRRADLVRHVSELDGKSVRAQHARGVRVDVDEVVGLDRQSLERPEEERPGLSNRTAEDTAPLELSERRLLSLDRVPERIEALEMIPGIQRFVPVVAERRSADIVRAAPGDDVHDAARGLAELRGVGVREHLELPARLPG